MGLVACGILGWVPCYTHSKKLWKFLQPIFAKKTCERFGIYFNFGQLTKRANPDCRFFSPNVGKSATPITKIQTFIDGFSAV